MSQKQIISRTPFVAISLLCLISVSIAYYAQFVYDIEPCPLCVAERVIFVLLGLLSLPNIFIKNRLTNIIISLALVALSTFAIKTNYHHVVLQHLPADELPMSCGMPLEILYQQLPLSGFLHTVLSGTAECAEVAWRVFGINAVYISFALFVAILFIALYALVKAIRR